MLYPSKLERILSAARKNGYSINALSIDPSTYEIETNGKRIVFYKNFLPLNTKNAVLLANDKHITKTILERNGLSVPRGIIANTPLEALEAATLSRLSYPLVAKPVDGSCGLGITVDIRDEEELTHALNKITVAQEQSKMLKDHRFIIEEMAVGKDYRILVLDGVFLACAMRIPASVTGDGENSIEKLIEIFNATRPHQFQISTDSEILVYLQEQNLTLKNIPSAGETIRLRKNANISMGGVSLDVSHETSSFFKETATMAAASLGLRFAGIDLHTNDIAAENKTLPYKILEVNGNLIDYDIHEKPIIQGTGTDVAMKIIETLFK